MRRLTLISVIVLCCAVVGWAEDTYRVAGRLAVEEIGEVYLSLVDERGMETEGEEGFAEGLIVEVSGSDAARGEVRFAFDGLLPGEYAIRCFLDENGNGELDTNLFGFPKERYGFSNNWRPVIGPPSFRDLAFRVASDVTDLTIEVRF